MHFRSKLLCCYIWLTHILRCAQNLSDFRCAVYASWQAKIYDPDIPQRLGTGQQNVLRLHDTKQKCYNRQIHFVNVKNSPNKSSVCGYEFCYIYTKVESSTALFMF